MHKADLILKNARVITMDARQPYTEMAAVSGGRVLLAGKSSELEDVTGASTRIIDCHGKTVMPGFNDAHCHIFSYIRKLLSVDLSPTSVSTIADIKGIIGRKAQETPAGEWIGATDYNEFYLAEKRHPTRWDLDEVAPHHPVVLSHRGLHACVLNSMALSLAGITRETPDPPGGIIERDPATGEPDGILFEMLGYIRGHVMPPLSEEELSKGAAIANRHYLSYGITSLQDATYRNDYGRWQILQHFKEKGIMRSRVYMMIGNQARVKFQEAGMATGAGDSDLRLGGVKLMLSGTTGKLQPPQSELNRQVLESHQSGFQLAFHAVEEETVEAAVKALEYISGYDCLGERRHRIEHCSECPQHLLERLGRLQIVIVTQPPFIYYNGERYLATLSERQLSALYRVKSHLDNGVVVAASSDFPVVPDNPLMGIYAAVTRKAATGQTILPEERVSVIQALEMYTRNAAYASFEEGIKGSISPGKMADIVVLSADPTGVAAEEIKDIRVEMTILGGRVVWES